MNPAAASGSSSGPIARHFRAASQVLPGGVNSSTRLNRALGAPMYVARAEGSRITDITGRSFIDLCCGHGAALLGHGHPAIAGALQAAAAIGFPSVHETPRHEELARLVCAAVPSAERVRFCSSGTEATLHLIRACRAHTGRDKIIRIEGHFHGYHELIYIGGHPPAEHLPRNRAQPFIESPGIPQEFARLIVPIPHNDAGALERAVERHGRETAAVMLEPVNWNWGAIRAEPAYLQRMRELTAEAGIVLFFDEIQSAFKTRRLTAQAEYGVTPDVTTLGKSLGGGLPVSAFSGSAQIMDLFQPVGPVQHSGTFNAHPVPILAALAFVRETEKPYFYDTLEALEDHFDRGLKRIIADHRLNMIAPVAGARFSIIFGRTTPPARYEDCLCHDNRVMLRFVRECYERGVYLHDYGGGPFHHGFSVQHTTGDLDEALNAMEDALKGMKRDGAVAAA